MFVNADAADPLDLQFFARAVRYEMLNDRVVLVGGDAPTMTTVDDWGQLVFLAADGAHTVGELVMHVRSQYGASAPPQLADQVKHVVREMSKRGFLTLRSAKSSLPYYLSMPVKQQDSERSKKLMEADGFIKPRPR
ncbi:hypothetical protein J2X90_006027 [Variovorax paradoxus]|uniref:PqqD family peptide modification chaperone n=1 Tax=Variovorax paradoxus TaxID=34073 RepID=UPI00278B6110|nr:PqqD family peptide modification chaperone [Variovorax paradoxus]MDQ0028174.1 hypothetical protein [Variovorax paradoxus]